MPRSQTVTLQTTSDAPLDDTRIGMYRVLVQLARGGTASVYLAEHLATHKRVAIKLLDPCYARRTQLAEQFMREHDISRAARHPGLIDVMGAHYCENGVPYLVMELLEGDDLGSLVDRDRVSIAAVLSIGSQVAAALAALHRAGYIHADIKPDNIFVMYDDTVDGWPRVKVIDFGVSRELGALAQADGTITGTPAYMPPEQWQGETSTKSDVYALGCMLYELLVGEQPFHGSLPQLMIFHTEHLPERPSLRRADATPTLDALVMRMLAKDPAMRPSMAEVELSLTRMLAIATGEDVDAIAS